MKAGTSNRRAAWEMTSIGVPPKLLLLPAIAEPIIPPSWPPNTRVPYAILENGTALAVFWAEMSFIKLQNITGNSTAFVFDAK